MIGKTHSAGTVAKINVARSGKNNPNFGKSLSEDTKALLSLTKGTAIYVYSF